MVAPNTSAATYCIFSCHKTMIPSARVVCDVMPIQGQTT